MDYTKEKRLSYYTSFNPILNVVGHEDSTYHIDAYTFDLFKLALCAASSFLFYSICASHFRIYITPLFYDVVLRQPMAMGYTLG